MTDAKLHTLPEVAEHFHLDPEQVVRRCSSSLNPWPHMRPSRLSSSWLFSDADIEDIEARIHRREIGVDAWGRTRVKSA